MRCDDTPWLTSYQSRPDARVRLLAFPHAGSSAAAYGGWAEMLSPEIELRAIEYPGHGSRRAERPFVRLQALVAAMAPQVVPVLDDLDGPYAVFGHSLGALIAFELVRRLQRLGGPLPIGLFVAGCRGPRLPPKKAPVYALPDEELIAELRAFNGTPDAYLANPDIMRLFLPALRADLEIADTYSYRPAGPVGERTSLPIFAYGGEHDDDTPADDLRDWARETDAPFVMRLYPGDHFFLRHAESRVLRDLERDLLAHGD